MVWRNVVSDIMGDLTVGTMNRLVEEFHYILCHRFMWANFATREMRQLVEQFDLQELQFDVDNEGCGWSERFSTAGNCSCWQEYLPCERHWKAMIAVAGGAK